MKVEAGNYLRTHILWFVALFLALVLVAVLGYFTFKVDRQEKADLMVDEVYFTTKEIGGPTTDIDIIVFVTNRAKNSVDGVVLRAFAVDTSSNLARSQARAELGILEGKKTGEGLLRITVPNNDTYRIEIIVFADEKIAIRGSGTVDLTGIGTASDYENEGDDDGDNQLKDTIAGGEGASLACLMLFLMLGAATVVVVIIIAIVKAVKKTESPPRTGGPELRRPRSELSSARSENRTTSDQRPERPEGARPLQDIDNNLSNKPFDFE